ARGREEAAAGPACGAGEGPARAARPPGDGGASGEAAPRDAPDGEEQLPGPGRESRAGRAGGVQPVPEGRAAEPPGRGEVAGGPGEPADGARGRQPLLGPVVRHGPGG